MAVELSLKNVLEEYLEDLEDLEASPSPMLTSSPYGYTYKNLSGAFSVSLSMMDRGKAEEGSNLMSYSEMYESLVIIPRQGWIPLSVIRMLWELDEPKAKRVLREFVKASLVERRVGEQNGEDVVGVTLHDLGLQYIHQRNGNGRDKALHKKLVRKWEWEEKDREGGVPWVCGRTWKSSVGEDEYFRNNLYRHMKSTGLLEEMQSVLSDPTWTAEKLCRGEGFGLQEDFLIFMGLAKDRGRRCEPGNAIWSLQRIAREARLSAPFVLRNSKEVWFQIYDRTLRFRHESKIIRSYLSRIRTIASKPWLKSLTTRVSASASNAMEDIMLCGEDVKGTKGILKCAMQNELTAWGKHGSCLFRRTFRNGTLKESVTQGVSAEMKDIWSQNRRYAATVESGRNVQVWDMHNGAAAIRAGPELNFPLDMACFWDLTGDGERLARGKFGGRIELWNIRTGAKIKEVASRRDGFKKVSFSPNGKRLASLGGCGLYMMLHGETGEIMKEYFLHEQQHEDIYKCVSWSKNGKRVAFGTRNNKLLIFDGDTGERLGKEATPPTVEIICLSWSEDGRRLLCIGSSKLSVRDGDSGQLVSRQLDMNFKGSTANCICATALSKSGRWVAAADNSHVVSVWDTATGTKVWSEQRSVGVQVLTWLDDGERLISVDLKGEIVTWRWPNPEEVECENGSSEGQTVDLVLWSGNEMCLSAAKRDGNVFMHDIKTGRVVWKDVETHASNLELLLWSKDLKWVFSLGEDRKVAIWDSKTGDKLWEDRVRHTPEMSISTTVCWSNDGTRVLACDSPDLPGFKSFISLWNGATGERIWERHVDKKITILAWSGNDTKIAFGNECGNVILLDSTTANGMCDAVISQTHHVRLVKWSPDDKWIASSAVWGNGIMIWNWKTGATFSTGQESQSESVSSIEWSDDGRRIAYGNGSGKVVVWDRETGERIERTEGQSTVSEVTWSHDASRLATWVSERRILQIWGVTTQDLVSQKECIDFEYFNRSNVRQLREMDERQLSVCFYERTSRVRLNGDVLIYARAREEEEEEIRLATVGAGQFYWTTSCRHVAILKKEGGLFFYELVK